MLMVTLLSRLNSWRKWVTKLLFLEEDLTVKNKLEKNSKRCSSYGHLILLLQMAKNKKEDKVFLCNICMMDISHLLSISKIQRLLIISVKLLNMNSKTKLSFTMFFTNTMSTSMRWQNPRTQLIFCYQWLMSSHSRMRKETMQS